MFLKLVALVLPVTTATVERTFSDMKMVKTRLRSRLGEDTLDDEKLECIISHWKHLKKHRIVLELKKRYIYIHTFTNMMKRNLFEIFWGGGKLPP